jgi:hypothetical protein
MRIALFVLFWGAETTRFADDYTTMIHSSKGNALCCIAGFGYRLSLPVGRAWEFLASSGY